MPDYSKDEVNKMLSELASFKEWAEPIIEEIPEIKKSQERMSNAMEMAKVARQQENRELARETIKEYQSSWWYRIKQISVALLVVSLFVLVISQSVDDSGKVDAAKLMEMIKELAK
jgi:protein subunit release factor A